MAQALAVAAILQEPRLRGRLDPGDLGPGREGLGSISSVLGSRDGGGQGPGEGSGGARERPTEDDRRPTVAPGRLNLADDQTGMAIPQLRQPGPVAEVTADRDVIAAEMKEVVERVVGG